MSLDFDKRISIASFHRRFRFVNKFTSNGYWQVFVAVDRSTNAPVTVMMVPLSCEAYRRIVIVKLRREIEQCNELNHPVIAKALSVGSIENGIVYVIFEYIDGLVLRKILTVKGAFPVAAALHYAGQILSTLNITHMWGIKHRNLSAESIMLSGNDDQARIMLLNFGLGIVSFRRLINSETYGSIIPTTIHLAPEQIRANHVSVQSDIYSWGILLLELLTGSLQHDKSALRLLYRRDTSISFLIPPTIRRHPLGELLRWSLEKEIKHRCGDGHILLRRLQQLSIDSIPTRNGILVRNL